MDIFAIFIHQRFTMTHFVQIASIVLMGLLFWIKVMAISWLFASCVIMREVVSLVFNMVSMGFFLSKCPMSCPTVKPGVPSASLISSYIKGMSTSVRLWYPSSKVCRVLHFVLFCMFWCFALSYFIFLHGFVYWHTVHAFHVNMYSRAHVYTC